MTRHDTDWTPETDSKPASAPRTRDELVADARATKAPDAPDRRDSWEDEAASAPRTEAPLSPRTEPAKTYGVNATDNAPDTGRRDVRAGPGDAGATDTPKRSPVPVKNPNDTWARAFGIIAAAALIAVVLSFLL